MTATSETGRGRDSDPACHVRLEHVTKRFTGRRDGDAAAKRPAVDIAALETGTTKRFAETRATAAASPAAVDDVSLEIATGEIFGVVGYSGAGKSTLVRLINTLERPTSGRIQVSGLEITELNERQRREVRREMGMIFQHFNLFRSRTVAGNVAYPLKVAGVARQERDRRVAELLDFVGLLERAHDHPEQLSGGQQQRVGIARALATQPALLLADEATSALDPETTADVLELLRRANQEFGITVVVVTHDIDVIREVADHVAVMADGKVVESGSVYDVFANPQTEVAASFARAGLQDHPSPGTAAQLRETHPGRIATVTIQGQQGVQATLQSAFTAHGVGAEIIYGAVRELLGKPVGGLTFALTGDELDIEAALAEIRAAGIRVGEGLS